MKMPRRMFQWSVLNTEPTYRQNRAHSQSCGCTSSSYVTHGVRHWCALFIPHYTHKNSSIFLAISEIIRTFAPVLFTFNPLSIWKQRKRKEPAKR